MSALNAPATMSDPALVVVTLSTILIVLIIATLIAQRDKDSDK